MSTTGRDPGQRWPTADLDPIRRLRVLADATGAGLFVEGIIALPFEQVWAVASDLEAELPSLLPDVRSLRITHVQGDRLAADVRGYLGLRARFAIVLRPGWCLMQSRFLLGGMAALPTSEGDETRFAFLGKLRIPGLRIVRPLLAPLERRVGRKILTRLEHRAQQRQQ
jgi:hypothetical protein